MIVQRFLRWCETAGSSQRTEGVAILARALAEDRVPAAELAQARSALVLVLDDASPKVRRALAETLAESERAPRAVIAGLLRDTEEIALLVVGSPVLLDHDLLAPAQDGSPRLQAAVAARRPLGSRLCTVIAETAGPAACEVLLRNCAAAIGEAHLRRLAERHGEDAGLRRALLDRADLPADIRQTLLLEIGRALQAHPFLSAVLGAAPAQRVVFDACERGTALIAEALDPAEMPRLVEHLRASGQLSTAFLVRLVCSGNIDLFAAAITALSGRSAKRVRAVLVDGREGPFDALLAACGLPAAAAPLLRSAIRIWKQVVAGRIGTEADDVPMLVMQRLAETVRARDVAAGAPAAALLARLEAETMRDSARHHALRLAAA